MMEPPTPEQLKAAIDAVDQFRASFEALQRRAEDLQREVDRKRRLEVLGEVSAMLAHEIRNPLGGILIYAEMLRRELADQPQKQELADKIIQRVQGLEGFVRDILEFAGEVKPQPWRQSAEPMLQRCLELAQPRAKERGVEILRASAGGPAEAEFDATLLERALLNLVLNGVDATPAGGRVRLDCAREGPYVALRVVDSGTGLSPEVQAKLFTPFFTKKAKGTGLGLALAQKIVAAHKGEIRARNNEPPPGATFEILLPAAT